MMELLLLNRTLRLDTGSGETEMHAHSSSYTSRFIGTSVYSRNIKQTNKDCFVPNGFTFPSMHSKFLSTNVHGQFGDMFIDAFRHLLLW